MDILVTGFKPFLGEAINPSEKLAISLADFSESVRSQILPVEFGKSFEVLKAAIDLRKPDYLIMIGQASGRKNICFEKIGLNWVQTKNKDENGQQPPTGYLKQGAELAKMSIFPVDQIYQQLKTEKLPVEISFSAGVYVCNDLYYRVLSEYPNLKSVFIHVPMLPEQIKDPAFYAMDFLSQQQVLKRILEIIVV